MPKKIILTTSAQPLQLNELAEVKRPSILYIEDDAITALVQKNALTRNGYLVTHVMTGEKALEAMAGEKHFDLILSDINLGNGIDGTETARQVLKSHDLPIVFMSSHTEKEVVEKVESITNYGYVVKNSGDFVLSQTLKGALRLFEANKKMALSEVRYRTLFESANDAIMLLTRERGFSDGNPATIKLFGCRDTAEFATKTPDDLSPLFQPDGKLSREKAQEMMRNALENGSHFFEWTHKRSDGSEFPATVLLTRMVLNGQKVLQATVRDITK
ncbi:MAG: response regulator, partial [Candidatus Margulisiibacteriota bacterium]